MTVYDQFLTRNQQLAAKQEAVNGTAETLAAADVKIKPFQEMGWEPINNQFENNEVAEDLGQAANIVSGHAGKLSFSCLLKTSGILGTVPAIGIYLEAQGHKVQSVKQISVGAPAGADSAFAAGETYSAAAGAKTGIIESPLSGAGVLRYIVTTGSDLASADVVVANGDSATASSASSSYGVKYTPRSSGFKHLTMQRGTKNDQGTSAQDYLYRLKGAVGTGGIEAAAGDSPRFRGEYTGAKVLEGAGSFLTGHTYEASTAPIFVNADTQLGGQQIAVSNFNLDFGVEIDLEPNPSLDGGVEGYDLAAIGERAPTISIDPKMIKPSLLDTLASLRSGAIVPFLVKMGTSPNMIEIVAPTCQIRADTEGNRGRRVARGITLHCVRGSLVDEDYAIYFR